MSTRCLPTELLAHAGRLLLEYDESTEAIHRTLTATSRALSDEACQVAVSYSGVAVSLAGEAPLLIVKGDKEYEIPFAEAFLKSVDLGHKRIVMELPEGLLELSAPLTAEEKEQQKRCG